MDFNEALWTVSSTLIHTAFSRLYPNEFRCEIQLKKQAACLIFFRFFLPLGAVFFIAGAPKMERIWGQKWDGFWGQKWVRKLGPKMVALTCFHKGTISGTRFGAKNGYGFASQKWPWVR